ncbi:DUF2911 domain-containing protein [Algoriphagus sp. SE2]|uniref:DUF2911 domain-containing protein n=1 Tax=Algoriphagus sp. SE2 TaxID=3141536 RepID=UPI0031CD2C9A
MNKKSILTALAFSICLVLTTQSFAQLQAPAPSPAASVSANVGFTKISIDYSSPAVKGRKVFGDLEKYGVTWRAGANGPTIIEFSTPVSVGGKNLAAGKYSLFITPMESGDWTVHLNAKGKAVFDFMADGKIDEAALAKDDAVSFKVKTMTTPMAHERLMYMISAEDNKVASIHFVWDKTMFAFPVDTQVDQKMEGFKAVF